MKSLIFSHPFATLMDLSIMDNPAFLFKILSTTAFSLLAIVTLGIAYLTVSDWRDRRRRENERRETTQSVQVTQPAKPIKTKR